MSDMSKNSYPVSIPDFARLKIDSSFKENYFYDNYNNSMNPKDLISIIDNVAAYIDSETRFYSKSDLSDFMDKLSCVVYQNFQDHKTIKSNSRDMKAQKKIVGNCSFCGQGMSEDEIENGFCEDCMKVE